jgi:RNA polymerase sigma-70 factor, ECF subfamily
MEGALGLAAVYRRTRANGAVIVEDGPDGAPVSDDRLEARLRELFDLGRRAWSAIDLEASPLAAFWGTRASPAALLELSEARAADGYLVCACASGNERAIAALERQFFPGIEPSLRRLRLDGPAVEEAFQRLRHELFVAGGGSEPRIAQYAGRGDLGGWLRVTAVRSALKMLRGKHHDTPFEEDQLAERVPVTGDEPDLAYMKQLYRPAFKAAFRDALGALPAREQTLLKQHLLDGLSIDQLAGIYQIHRATAARWLSRAREALMRGTRESFQARAKISREECDSIMRMIRSQLDVTFRSQLGSP